MSQVDTYRNTYSRKKEELAKLQNDLAIEEAKIAPQKQKILSAESAIKRTKNHSTIKSKLNEIDRANKAIIDITKKCDAIQKKISQKRKELTTAEKNYLNAESREDKKHTDAEKKRQRDATKQMNSVINTLNQTVYQQGQLAEEIAALKSLPNRITVLFMASNPIDTGTPLRLDAEARDIQQKIQMSEYRDSIVFETRWATRTTDILQAINETKPTIIHFSGHGATNGDLVLENSDGTKRFVPKETITTAISTASDTVRLVVFNACFSEAQAQSITRNIDSAIGMSTSIGDTAARVFAAQLYSSIGFGRSLQASFNQAIAALLLEGIPEQDTPKLYAKPDIDLNELILVDPNN